MSAHILVIDDESQIRKMLRIALKSVGYQVSEAESVATGLAALLLVWNLGFADLHGARVGVVLAIQLLRQLLPWLHGVLTGTGPVL